MTVPLHDELETGTLREVVNRAGATDFDSFRDWIHRNASTLTIVDWIKHASILSPYGMAVRDLHVESLRGDYLEFWQDLFAGIRA